LNRKTAEIILKHHLGVLNSNTVERNGKLTEKVVMKSIRDIKEGFKKDSTVYCPKCGNCRYMYHAQNDEIFDDYPWVCIKCGKAFVIVDDGAFLG
jgi:DNA-directed RNA polymerase subunit M/transcription elongation factor TFIIS